MKLAELGDKSVLLLGLGREGESTLRYLRSAFPDKTLGLADQLPLEKLGADMARRIGQDAGLRLHLGEGYLASLADYDVIVKSPGIAVTLPAYRQAVRNGKQFTSHTALCFANFPGTILGVTGTKGKSTTASLLHAILKTRHPDAHLAGNIGVPALDLLPQSDARTLLVYELSSHQLEGLRQSPHVAVLLHIVPEHMDYYESFAQYAAAKENITRYQGAQDVLVYDADFPLPREVAARSQAVRLACSLEEIAGPGCWVSGDRILWRDPLGEQEEVLTTGDVPLLGRFNLKNVAAAVAAAKWMGLPSENIAGAVRSFQPLEHRLERVGVFGGVAYYNDAIATVPEATLAALDALGEDVETVLLGGADRHLDFTALAKRLIGSPVRTVILFPATGERIWQALCSQCASPSALPQHFFVASMEQAVSLARQHTRQGKICLHSPASPSFGLFRDYRERGEQFKRWVEK